MTDSSNKPAGVDGSAASRCSVALAVRDDLLIVFAAWRRLIDQGWLEPHPYTDKDYDLLIIEPGSTGVHFGICDGTEFGYWVIDGDAWPSRPLLVKRLRKLS